MTAVFCTQAYYRVFRDEVLENLEICIRLLSEKEMIENKESLEANAEKLYDDLRLTLIRPDGSVVFDSVAKPEELDNHKDRVEIEQAMKKGEGKSIRRSATINRTNYYYAIRMEDGSVLRASRESHSIINIFWHALPMIILAVIVIDFACFYISRLWTRRLLAPIEVLADKIDQEGRDCP